jgi:hypothetical protein
MDLEQRVTLFAGNFGSGKTETAVSFAHFLLDRGERVRVLDLDIVNPYFRCREAREDLESRGAELIAPRAEQSYAELPIILPEVRGSLRQSSWRVIGDVGGDDSGARVLSSLADAFDLEETLLLLVLNMNRPFTETAAGCLQVLGSIEAASRLRVGGLVSNTHLMDETTPAMIGEGYELAREVGRRAGVPVLLVTVEDRLAGQVDPGRFDCPLLPLRRVMLPPWAVRMKSDLTSLPG